MFIGSIFRLVNKMWPSDLTKGQNEDKLYDGNQTGTILLNFTICLEDGQTFRSGGSMFLLLPPVQNVCPSYRQMGNVQFVCFQLAVGQFDCFQ